MKTAFICAFLSGSLIGGIAPTVAQEIVAHRGASFQAPENTLASVRLGYALGADAVEIDVHLSKDNRIMVIHDGSSKRTAGGVNYSIKTTKADDLRKLDVGSWKGEEYKGEKIPYLEEVLAVVPEQRTLFIEVKSGPEILPYLKEQMEESGILDQLLVISFNKEVVTQAKEMMPDIPIFWLLHNYHTYPLEEAIKTAQENRLDGLDVHYALITPSFMQKMQEAGLEVYAYTVNEPEEARRLRELKVKGITTDRPKWLKEQMSR